jgi:hypothetical protein
VGEVIGSAAIRRLTPITELSFASERTWKIAHTFREEIDCMTRCIRAPGHRF